MQRIAAGLLALTLGAGLAACSASGTGTSSSATSSATSSGTSSPAGGSGSAARPALCDSVDALRASVQRLGDVNLAASGLGGFEDAWQAVQANLKQVADDAHARYAPQVDKVKADVAAVGSAADAAGATPSAATLSAVRDSVHTLADDVGHLVDEVSPEC